MANFAAVANHFIGAAASQTNPDGTQVDVDRVLQQLREPARLRPDAAERYLAVNVLWNDVARAAHLRYGYVDATAAMIAAGRRAARRHRHAGALPVRRRASTSPPTRGPTPTGRSPTRSTRARRTPGTTARRRRSTSSGRTCEIEGTCNTYFTGPKTGRTGPVGVVLPPGYALEANRVANVRYPVALRPSRLRAGPPGPRGIGAGHEQLHERLAAVRRDAPGEDDRRLRRRPVPHRPDHERAGVHPGHVLRRLEPRR